MHGAQHGAAVVCMCKQTSCAPEALQELLHVIHAPVHLVLALAIARKLAAGPRVALELIRDQAWAALDNSFDEQLALEREYQRTASRTDDCFPTNQIVMTF